MIYLNHAGTSWPKPALVRAAIAEALEAPVEEWGERFDAAHRAVARAFGVRDPQRLLLTPGCTSALAVAIADHPWERGDRILISGLEHHALHRPARKLEELGVELAVAPRAAGEPVVLDAVEDELRRGGVRLVAMTAASNVTGELLPIAEIAALAHAHGALCLVDAAQIAGWMAIDVAQLGVDLLTFAGHKGPQGPWGIGGLYVAPQVVMTSPAASCSATASGEAAACASMPGYCDVGSVDRAALAGLAAGLAWLAEPERANRLERARALLARLARGVEDLPGLDFHGPPDPMARVPALALTIEHRSPTELAEALAARGIAVAGGLQCAPLAHETLGTAPFGVLRLSLGPASEESDVERAIEALRVSAG